jgi:hypothetical protein
MSVRASSVGGAGGLLADLDRSSGLVRSLQATSRGNSAPESVKKNPIQRRKNVQFIVDSLSEASEPARAKRDHCGDPREAARDHGDVHCEPPIEIVD